jgi:chitin disaccharide deacetylase
MHVAIIIWRTCFMRKLLEICCLCILTALPAGAAFGQKKSVAERLGYPGNAKLLIIHADDLALSHSVDQASLAALAKGAVTTGSIMVPCPWFTEVAAYVREHPDVDLGLHLTLTSEWKSFRWGPLASRRDVIGLLDPMGYLWLDTPLVMKSAKPAEVEMEIRAQIETALKAGIRPTHLDSHMATLFAPAFFPVYVKLAREYGLPFFALRILTAAPALRSLIQDSDVIPDSYIMATESVKPERWGDYYLEAVRSLKPGLTEMIVHLGKDDAELQAITEGHPAYGSAWRQRDFETVTGAEFRKALEENHVILVGWKEIKKLSAAKE